MDAVRARPLPPTPGNLAWAKAVLGHLLAYGHSDSFAYSTPQDECHSFARFLTPFCRGLIDWAKGPVWTFEADEAGTGKDTLADITHVQQTGCEIGYSPSADNEEMRKGITSFLLAGGSFYHLGNVRGAFRCAPFEQASSASRIHCDRLLGQSKTLRLRNEAEYSFPPMMRCSLPTSCAVADASFSVGMAAASTSAPSAFGASLAGPSATGQWLPPPH